MVMASAMARSRAGFFWERSWRTSSSSAAHALVAQELGEAGLEEIVARGVEHILREAEDELAQIAVVGAGGCFHLYTTIDRIRAIREQDRGRTSSWPGGAAARPAMRTISGAMASRGSTLWARPAWATAPGIPQTVLVACPGPARCRRVRERRGSRACRRSPCR